MKNKYILPIAIALVGVYFILTSSKKPKDELPPAGGQPTGGSDTPPVGTGVGTTSPPTTVQGVEKYIVKTTSGNLNIRSLPSTTSTIVGTVMSGTEISARPSKVSGWHEMINMLIPQPSIVGYVSSAYIFKK